MRRQEGFTSMMGRGFFQPASLAITSPRCEAISRDSASPSTPPTISFSPTTRSSLAMPRHVTMLLLRGAVHQPAHARPTPPAPCQHQAQQSARRWRPIARRTPPAGNRCTIWAEMFSASLATEKVAIVLSRAAVVADGISATSLMHTFPLAAARATCHSVAAFFETLRPRKCQKCSRIQGSRSYL